MSFYVLGREVVIATGLTSAFILTGCVSPQATSAYSPTLSFTSASSFNPGHHSHQYIVTVTDIKGKPIPKATVEWLLDSGGDTTEATNKITAEDGSSKMIAIVYPKLSMTTKWADYKSTAKITVRAAGYESSILNLTASSYVSGFGESKQNPKSETVRLIKPGDYLAPDFSDSKQYTPLRTKVQDFLDIIRIQSLLNKAELKFGGIRMQEFKGRRYLVIEVNSENVYNSLKLDRYAVGKNIFDESVRKILSPLNEKIADPKLFYGYNLIVNTRTKSFAEKYAVGDSMKYEFLMPQDSVKRYKDKDISGQKLIDDSIVLLNDERIDLKFQ